MRKFLLIILFCLWSVVARADGITVDTALCVHCDEDDGTAGTSILDSSFTNTKTLTAVGNAQTDSGITHFDNTCLFDGTGDYIKIPDSEDWDSMVTSLTGNASVGMWINWADLSSEVGIFQQWVSTVIWMACHIGSDGSVWYFVRKDNGSGVRLDTISMTSGPGALATAGVDTGEWHYYAVARDDADFGFYIDENQVAFDTLDYTSPSITATLDIGLKRTADTANASFDEIRWQNDDSLGAEPNSGKTDTITVPTEAYSVAVTRNRQIFISKKEFILLPTGGYDKIVKEITKEECMQSDLCRQELEKQI